MRKEDYYAILGVARNAKEPDIKKAYRRMARKNHPDVNPGDRSAEERFKKIQEAYDVLRIPKAGYLRQVRFLFGKFQGTARGQGRGFSEGFSGFSFSGMDFGESGQSSFRDVFAEFFGGAHRSRSSGPAKGEDLEHHLNISFMESIRGLSTRIVLNRRNACKSCDGSGVDRVAGQQICTKCQGTGQESKAHGFMRFSGTCRTCNGTGRIGGRCWACGGSGTVPLQESITVRIPAGVAHGFRMRVAGKGNAGRSGSPGDLYLIISVRPHEFFRREGTISFARFRSR